MATEWIAVDWGTTSLRAWAMQGDLVLQSAQSGDGMGALTPDAFEPALLDLISPWLGEGVAPQTPMTVLASGMVGARQGWVETPYARVPCPAAADALTKAPTQDPRIDVRIAPGISQSDPPDVMRGEETQIAGFLSDHPRFDGVICLPGTHTKWVHISAEEIVSFRTFMSGEMFALLSSQSVLRHSIGDAWDDGAFTDAVGLTLSRPERLAAELFSIRAASLLTDQTVGQARARLSGLLLGAELAAAKPYWLGQPVALIGAPTLTQHYATALARQGLSPTQHDAGDLTRVGLHALYKRNS